MVGTPGHWEGPCQGRESMPARMHVLRRDPGARPCTFRLHNRRLCHFRTWLPQTRKVVVGCEA